MASLNPIYFVPKRVCFQLRVTVRLGAVVPMKAASFVAATTLERPKKRNPGEAKGFVQEMKAVALKLHTKEQAKGDAEFKNTGLERSESLAKDLDWLKEQGHTIPEPSSPGVTYAQYLNDLAEKDPPPFICHFYNIYFAHRAGGRIIGRKVAEMINGKELEFYKWDGDVKQMLQNVRDTLNKVSEGWSREEKDHCLEETAKSFKYSREILRLVLS